MGEVKCARQTHNSRNIFSAAAKHALLPSPHNQPLNAKRGVNVEKSRALGTVKLVRTAGQEIHIQSGDVHGIVAHGLHGVAVEVRTMRPANALILAKSTMTPTSLLACIKDTRVLALEACNASVNASRSTEPSFVMMDVHNFDLTLLTRDIQALMTALCSAAEVTMRVTSRHPRPPGWHGCPLPSRQK